MANKNAFLGVRLDSATMEVLDAVAKALESNAPHLLGMPEGTGFEAQDTSSLHMTFLFFGENLRALPGVELQDLHQNICQCVNDALGQAAAPVTPLQFKGFELFPPQKMNLVVARFHATDALLDLRAAILGRCHKVGISLPPSYFALIEGEGAWSPHVTLGKIRASRADVGHASCSCAQLQMLAPATPAVPLGLTLHGERPPRAWCDWDKPLAFGADEGLLADPEDLTRTLSSHYGVGASKYDQSTLKEWEDVAESATKMLNAGKREKDAEARSNSLQSAAELFETAAELRPDFVRSYVGGSLALQLLERWVEARNMLLWGLEACSDDKILSQELCKLKEKAEAAGTPLPVQHAVQPLPGPGAQLTVRELSARWATLMWKHKVVAFKGTDERAKGSQERCFSNFYDEQPFWYELPSAFGLRLKLNTKDRFVKCLFSEKAIMLCKAAIMGDLDSYRCIIDAETPLEAKNLGKRVDNWDDAQWHHVLCSVAFDVVWQKFSKTPALQPTLLATGDSLIAEATRADQVWGIGIDKGCPTIQRPSEWKGANVLGWALMEVRAELRRSAS